MAENKQVSMEEVITVDASDVEVVKAENVKVVTEKVKEEEVVEQRVFKFTTEKGEVLEFETANEFAKHLIAEGGDPVKSVEQAKATFLALEGQVIEQPKPAGYVHEGKDGKTYLFPTVSDFSHYLIVQEGADPVEAVETAKKAFDELEVIATAKPEKVAETVKEEPAKEEPKLENSKMKSWLKRASEKMSLSSKEQMITRLWMEKKAAKTEEEKEEIQCFIDRLENEPGLYKSKVEPVVATVKGWTVDGSGKVADSLYLVGDYAGKGAEGVTKVTGKIITKAGEAIVKVGEFVEEQAPNVGKVVEAPFKMTGDAIKVLNGQNKPETKTTPEADNK